MTGSGSIPKALTGIAGLDEITEGGLPEGRPALVCGGPGCGKTVLAMEFLVRGAVQFGEPGLFMSFEESAANLTKNFSSLGFDLAALVASKRLKISHVALSRSDIIQTGQFSLEALRIRIEAGINEIGAKRVALDTMETMFAALGDSENLRAEIASLFHWLREKGVTAIVTGERGKEELTRHGFEEYLSDCVLSLDHRISAQISKRRLRIVKYRGSGHGKDEYPFVIGASGLSILPITSIRLEHPAPVEHVSSGVKELDALLDGKGYFKGSTVLVSGKAGTGKSSLASAFAASACERGERCLYFSFEESRPQLSRNMRSLGIDLDRWYKTDALIMQATRPSALGLEEHLIAILEQIDRYRPSSVVFDPITDFLSAGGQPEVKAMMIRIIDYLKSKQITLLLTALTAGSGRPDETEDKVSSLIDTWLALDLEPQGHTRRRELYIVKSRGMRHSHDTMEFAMSSRGLSLRPLESRARP